MGQPAASIDALVRHPAVIPLAAEHGGFLFCQIDAVGFVRELHTLFTPEGWGREVLAAAKQAFDAVFAGACQMVTTTEVAGWWRSRPPRSFGFRKSADFAPCPPFGDFALWSLSKADWTVSPAARRHTRTMDDSRCR